MLAAERHQAIVTRVLERGAVRVAQLAREFAVTEETIRRDLEKLDGEGKLRRTHGGAVPLGDDRHETPLEIREAVQTLEKRAIAHVASRHILEGDVVALDASSTAQAVARDLPNIAVTVVTNSLAVASSLMDRGRVRVFLCGGMMDGPSRSMVGPIAEQFLAKFNIKKAFVSCQGIDLERGLSVTADEHASIKRRMMDLAEKVYVVADSSKFGVKAVEFFGEIAEVDVIIVDDGVEKNTVDALRGMGVEVEVAAVAR